MRYTRRVVERSVQRLHPDPTTGADETRTKHVHLVGGACRRGLVFGTDNDGNGTPTVEPAAEVLVLLCSVKVPPPLV
jgi:hypothetical protein